MTRAHFNNAKMTQSVNKAAQQLLKPDGKMFFPYFQSSDFQPCVHLAVHGKKICVKLSNDTNK